MSNKNKLKGGLLLAVFLAAPAAAVSAESAGTRGDKVMLSLQIAKARKEPREIELYKSLARQRKHRRPFTAPPPSSAR